jgi:murein DD-endopeptidase MepM/ murein hydrolase activator NlpD
MFSLLLKLGKLFLGIFAKSPTGAQSDPIEPPWTPPPIIQPPPIQPPPIQPPPIQPPPPPAPPPVSKIGPQSHWWAGTFTNTQRWGCTDLAMEGHNPFHPECEWFHEGDDFALPCGHPIIGVRGYIVEQIDPPGYGPVGDSAALHLRGSVHDIWIYHMQDYHVRVGQTLLGGELLGHSGTRGYSTGCHVHFEVRPTGAPYRHSINPVPFL